MRYMLSRLAVNMTVSCGWSFVVVKAMKRAYNYVYTSKISYPMPLSQLQNNFSWLEQVND